MDALLHIVTDTLQEFVWFLGFGAFLPTVSAETMHGTKPRFLAVFRIEARDRELASIRGAVLPDVEIVVILTFAVEVDECLDRWGRVFSDFLVELDLGLLPGFFILFDLVG